MEAVRQTFSDVQNLPYYEPVMEGARGNLPKKNHFQFNKLNILKPLALPWERNCAPFGGGRDS